MALNRNLLRAYNERQIHISEFLERLRPVKELTGQDAEDFRNRIAEEIEKEFPIREDKKPWVLARNGLAAAVVSLGYPEEFGDLLAKELGSPKAIERMASWLYHEKPKSMELIVDEMLAIRAEIDAWRKKAEGWEAQAAYSRWLNSETRKRNADESY